jgi:two-component system sensor kinase
VLRQRAAFFKRLHEKDEDIHSYALRLKEVNKELEAFSYSVSHDLKAPLRAMAGFANILLEDYRPKLDDEGKRIIGVINDNTIKMGQLIEALLALSHVGRKVVEVSDIDMTDLARTVCTELKVALGEDRKVEIALKAMPSARADYTLAKQVLINLISNAIKFTGHNEKAVIEIGGYDKGEERVYYVKDNGVGFDMQYAHKLFGVFQRLHSSKEFEGNGVGLALVQQIIMRHGGRIWFEAEVGKGATFYFTLLSSKTSRRLNWANLAVFQTCGTFVIFNGGSSISSTWSR